MEAVPSSSATGASSAAQYAQVAAQRWQITLPPVQFRMLGKQGHGFAGTFGSGYSWAAYPTAAQENPERMVEWSDIHEIQLASSTLSDADALPVVIAHEVSHLVLERDRVTTGRRAEDEVLTDVATALVGYGILMRRLRCRERRFFGPGMQLGWSISGPGYLFPEELDYVLLRQAQLMQGPQDGTAAPRGGPLTRTCSRQAGVGQDSLWARRSRWPSSGSFHSCGRGHDRLQLICTSLGRQRSGVRIVKEWLPIRDGSTRNPGSGARTACIPTGLIFSKQS